MARMSLKKAFDAFMDAELVKSINHVKSIYYDGDVLKAGATIEEATEHINRVKNLHAGIYKNAEELAGKQEKFLNKTLNGSKGRKAFINGESYAISGSLKKGDLYPSIMPIGDNIREGVLMYDTASWFEGARTGKSSNGKINSFNTNLNNFINNPNIEIETDGDAFEDIKAARHRAREAAKNGSPSSMIKDKGELEDLLEKKSFSAPNLSRTNNRGPLRPDMVMNGNSLEIDSIYNYSVPKSVNKGWGHTSTPTQTGNTQTNNVHTSSTSNTPTKTFKDWRDQYVTSGLWTTGQGKDGSLGRVKMDMSKGSKTPGYSNTDDIQLMNSWAMATNQEIDDYIERISKEGYGADDLKKIKNMIYEERDIGRHISVDDWLKKGNVRQNHTDAYRHFIYNGKEYYATGKGGTGFWNPSDLESPVFMNVVDAETGGIVDFGKNFFNPDSPDPSSDYDYFYKVINDVEDLGYVSLNDMKDHINKNIEKNKNNVEVNTQQTQTHTQQQPEVQTQPETQTRQDRTNVSRNGKPDQGPIPNTTSGPYVNNTRIDLDPETSVSTMDISDPLNIHQRIVDGNGNTRDITWRRKGRWSDQKELVSDISWNKNGVFDNIAQTYTGKDVSPIEWKYAADWSDNYIIGRAGDDEKLLNSMMNARERKIEARRKYEEKHNRQQQSSNTADNTAQQQVDGPKTFDPNDPTTWTDKDIANMADGDPELYEELLKQRNEATGGSTQNVEAANETVNPPDTEPDIEPDMSNPLNWTDEYMDEMSEGDPTYYEQLSKQRDAAIKADKYKNIDPSNPSSWTDDYIKDTALNEDEFNWMNEKMRQAKNLDIVDNINQQRHSSQPNLNREQRRQQTKDNKQKGNQQKKKTKKQKAKDKKNKKFNDRHTAMGNDPEDQRRINKEYNEAKRIEKEQEQQRKEMEEQEKQRRRAEAEQQQRIDSGDPSQWTDEDIRKMADGDPDVAQNLINQRDKARGVDTSQRTSDYNKDMGDTDAPKVGDADIEKLEAEGLQGTDMDASMRRGKLGTVDKIMTGVNILGAIGDYKSYRRQGDNIISAGVKTAAKFAIDEALGLWAIPIAIVKNTPGAIIKGADMLYKENRKMNSAAGQQIFGDAQFLDTQQLATMRQSGMEMAKMSQYNLQQTLMGNEATYLHR